MTRRPPGFRLHAEGEREPVRLIHMSTEGYSPLLLDHFSNPRNAGLLDNPDALAEVSNPVCGDTMRLSLHINEDRITQARFQTVGCPAAIATSSAATEMIVGRSLSEALGLTRADFANAVGGLPPSKLHCSVLAADALSRAIGDYRHRHANHLSKHNP